MSHTELAVLAAYYAILLVLAVFGLHRAHLTLQYFRTRRNAPREAGTFEALPRIAVQLPIYNEATVVERLIDAACRLDYPRELLEIQVLDDSNDETVAIAARKVEEWRARGVDIRHVRRGERAGYKAGALAAGLRRTEAEFLAIFDADFVPPRDFLKRLVHHFVDPRVGMVQARWGHLNRRFSLFTRIQAILLDGHFVIEHASRNRAGCFFNFNGTAGIWRRAAIEEAGGWQHDTLTEDLDLSYRAQLAGWKFVYRSDVVCPAELPIEMNAFKSQQRRWAKGSIQTAKKLLPRILRSGLEARVRSEATFHLTNNFSYLLMIGMFVLMLPAFHARLAAGTALAGWIFDLSLFLAATSSLFAFYMASQRENEDGEGLSSLLLFPLVLSLGIGIAVSNSAAVLEALRGRVSEFVRTPKYAAGTTRRTGLVRYAAVRSKAPWIELALALHFSYLTWLALSRDCHLAATFMALFGSGFYWCGLGSLLPARVRAASGAPTPVAAELKPAAPVTRELDARTPAEATRTAIHTNTGAY
jgi:cellulose synthase/poly-beta-1,6-N-acetylglucosamine synthase-like glycosyltransferase